MLTLLSAYRFIPYLWESNCANLYQKVKNSYHILDVYGLRTPLLPLNNFHKQLHKQELESKDYFEMFKNSILREAIYLASPELYNQILKWEDGYLTESTKIKRLQFAILKYAMRITSRCTPFGLFARCGSGSFDQKSDILLNHPDLCKRITRFDTSFLTLLMQNLVKEQNLRTQLLFYPNTSLYEINDHYRYVEYNIVKTRRVYSLEGIMKSEVIELLLDKAQDGATISELANLLVDEETTLKESQEFIEELILNQLLLSELEITVTGPDYFTSLNEKIKQFPECHSIYEQLKAMQIQLSHLDERIGNDVGIYKNPTELAKEFVPDLDTKYLYQTDCFLSTSKNHLSADLKKQLQQVFVLFNRMTQPTGHRRQEDFKTKFSKRFEEAEVPLHLALDAESGIGYGNRNQDTSTLLEDLILGDRGTKRYERVIWTDTDQIVYDKLTHAIGNKDYSIELSDEDFKEFSLDFNDLPDTLSSIIEIYENDQIFIKSAGGTSAINLLGRFSHGDDRLGNHVKNMAQMEAAMNEDKILAEIVHLPEARTGNILQRPHIRDYEIPYIGYSSVDRDHQIPVEDLMISVRNSRIYLRSKKLQKEVIPRLGNAHNYAHSKVPMYQFLCELQAQHERTWIGFEWNTIHLKQHFLPRVTYKSMILSKARWRIKTDYFKALLQSYDPKTIKKWQNDLKLPDTVELIEGDNKLLIHLNNKSSLEMLLHAVKKVSYFIVEEFLFTDDFAVKDEDHQGYCNQFVVAYYNKQKLDRIDKK